jgi:hypothetical protein
VRDMDYYASLYAARAPHVHRPREPRGAASSGTGDSAGDGGAGASGGRRSLGFSYDALNSASLASAHADAGVGTDKAVHPAVSTALAAARMLAERIAGLNAATASDDPSAPLPSPSPPPPPSLPPGSDASSQEILAAPGGASLSAPDNKGRLLMYRMGWRDGQGLGKQQLPAPSVPPQPIQTAHHAPVPAAAAPLSRPPGTFSVPFAPARATAPASVPTPTTAAAAARLPAHTGAPAAGPASAATAAGAAGAVGVAGAVGAAGPRLDPGIVEVYQRPRNAGLGHAAADAQFAAQARRQEALSRGDTGTASAVQEADAFAAYRQRMSQRYDSRPNPANNPRRRY